MEMSQQSQYFDPASRWTTNFFGKSQRMAQGNRSFEETDIHEEDMPMDDFDRALLAESPEVVQSNPLTWESTMSLRDERHGTMLSNCSSSSPIFPVSSPTIAVLHNRQQLHDRSVNRAGDVLPHTPESKQKPGAARAKAGLPLSLNLGHAPPVVQGIHLVEVSILPDKHRALFKFPLFNAVQSKCFVPAYKSNDNLVLSAPTGSGKTAVMELAICKLLMDKQDEDFKVVYQAPTKSLCSERYRDWSAKFRGLGLQCAELTGDVELANLKNVQQANVIIATPEKWDSVTRKWKDNAKLMRMIKLFLVDEVHILKEVRGATLEAVVSRMKSVGSDVRFVALSATVPNSEDIATWLGLNSHSQHLPAIREVFGESFRPTKLEKHVVGYQSPPNEFILDNMLVKEVPAIIAQYSKRKPVMIFCPTQKSATKMARSLADLWLATAHQSRLWNGPRKEIKAANQELQKLAKAAVAFHHGSLDVADRQAVENGFLNGDINVICSTSTLAVGVNLPCYLVILKGTSCYTDAGLQEYSILEVMQMLGRAGRPQFETSACAVIMTSKEKVARYEKLCAGQDVLESSLHENLAEHLNAEIGIGTITDICSAKRWMRSTFLHVRVARNPAYYKLPTTDQYSDREDILEALCKKDLEALEAAHLIEGDSQFRSTESGLAMARYYVKIETMKSLMAISPEAKQSGILNALTQAIEFKELRWKTGEKGLYKKINKSNEIRYPIKVDIALTAHKASLIIQAALGGYILDKDDGTRFSLQLQQDTRMVLMHANRLIRCIIDIQLSRKNATTAKNALDLGRSLAAKVWDDTPMQLKQIEGIGDVTARKLASHGITSIDILASTESHKVELILGKNPPFGRTLLSRVSRFPSLLVIAREVSKKRKANGGAEIKLRCEIGSLNETAATYFNKKLIYVCFLCETTHGELIDFRRFSISRLSQAGDFTLTTHLQRPTSRLICHVMCDEVAGTHRYAELKLDLPSVWFSPQNAFKIGNVECEPRNSGRDSNNVEEFEVDNIFDEDFFAAELEFTNPESLLAEPIAPVMNTRKERDPATKRKALGTSDDEEQDHWREPVKLPNGNWTCQHTCVDENKSCKHQCCKDGVKKPRKRSKKDPGQDHSNNAMLASEASPSECNKGTTRTRPRSIEEILKSLPPKNQGTFSDHATTAPSQGCSEQVPKRQHDEELDLCQTHSDLFSDSLPDIKDIVQNVAVPQKSKDGTSHPADPGGGFDEGEFEIFDFADCDWDLCGNVNLSDKRGTSTPVKASAAKAQVSVDSQKPIPVPLTSHTTPKSVLTRDNLPHKLDVSGRPIDNAEAVSYVSGESTNVSNEDMDIVDGNQCSQSMSTVGDDVRIGVDENFPILRVGHHSDVRCAESRAKGQRKEREYEEDQKRKWAEFDPWLYEQFGSYVDII